MTERPATVESTWWEEQAPIGQTPPRFNPDSPPARIAQRYKVLGFLGRGGPGTVWRCLDLLEGQEVAVKVLSALTERELASVRREAVAMRWARLPGVVRLRDELRIGDDWFLVMDLVPGRPFPGGDGPVPWASLEPFARRLLEVLGTLHDAGVVHGDLKPQNVFILPTTQDVVLLDLGLATGRSIARARSGLRFTGTPRYAAPEQLGGNPDYRADLYAVGVMLSHALAGQIPLYHSQPLVMVSRRAREAAPSIGMSVPSLPLPVVELIDSLLAALPEDRPASAWLALERIGGRAPAPLSGSLVLPEGLLDDAALRGLVHGPDAFLHLREDTARVLYARTGGQSEAVREELAAWLRAGLARWEDGALRIERPAIARLEAGEAFVEGPPISGPGADLRLLIGMAHPYATVESLSVALGQEVRGEVQALIEQGLVWPVGEALGTRPVRAFGRPEAALLRPMASLMRAGDPARVELLFRGGAALGEIVEAIEEVLQADALVPERVLAMLEPHLARARAEGDGETVLRLLVHWACFALAMLAPGPAERALFEVQRALAEGDSGLPSQTALQQIEGLLKAALSFTMGDFQAARSQGGDLAAFDRDDLESWRCGILVELARQEGDSAWAASLDALREWAAGSASHRASLDGWVANRLYSLGQFAESATLHERAAAGKAHLSGRASSLRNAASAWMEAGEYGLAAMLAEQVAELARSARLPRLEAMSTWCERGARSRLGEELALSDELVGAAFQVAPFTGAMMALGEACIAWRAGEPERAAGLGSRAISEFKSRSWHDGEILARVVVLLGRERLDAAEVDELLDVARKHAAVGIQIQALGLFGQRTRQGGLLAEARRLAEGWRTDNRGSQLELASLEDAIGSNSLNLREQS